jgi:hypothetical protein
MPSASNHKRYPEHVCMTIMQKIRQERCELEQAHIEEEGAYGDDSDNNEANDHEENEKEGEKDLNQDMQEEDVEEDNDCSCRTDNADSASRNIESAIHKLSLRVGFDRIESK